MKKRDAHKITLPRVILRGDGVIDKVGEVCQSLELGKNAIVVTGPTTRKVAGDRVASLLKSSGFASQIVISKGANEENVEAAKKGDADFIVGVGGGSVNDVAKLAASDKNVPFVSVPTSAANDGIASSRSSIKRAGSKTSIEAETPIAVIADIEILSKSPHRYFAAGCGDVISNYTSVLDWKLAHKEKGEYYGVYAGELAWMSSNSILSNVELMASDRIEGTKLLIEALISSGVSMGIAGSTRPASGSEHMFSHALEVVAPKPALHGEQCGVGTIMMAFLHQADWEGIKNALERLKAPTTAKELGIEPEHLIKALTVAHNIRPGRYTILRDGLSAEKAEHVARKTGVI